MKKVVIIEEKNPRGAFNNLVDWLIRMVGYALVLIVVSLIFKKTIYIDSSYYGLWGLIAAVIMYVLNRTIKPLIFWLTLPITGLTLGLFYPFINLFILKMMDFLLGSHFDIHGIFVAAIVAILISFMNILMDAIILNPILRKDR